MWASDVFETTGLFEINISRNRITGVAPYYAMYGRNPRVPLDVFFPDNHIQGVLKWTNFVCNLSKHYMSPRGMVNLSKKLTLRWTGPYTVTGTPTDSLSVINPIGNWAVNKRELHVLTSRLRKIDPAYYKPVNEQIDLDQLFDENDEDNEVQISMDRESNASPDVNIEKQADMFIDSSEDEDEYVPQGVTKTSDNLETPRNVSPQLCPQNINDNPPILQPVQIKLENEAEISLPQNRSTSTEMKKRKYNHRVTPSA